MRHRVILAIVVSSLLALSAAPTQSSASWFVDPKKFHASVHGQKSCQDCHGEVAKRQLHPDPGDVSKSRLDFFAPHHCLVCHGDTQEKLRQGIHGSRRISNREEYDHCLSCHDPHEQTPVGERADRFDPSKPRQEQCGVCHEARKALPPFSPEDETCMACHQLVSPDDEGRMRRLCFHCHADEGTEAQKRTGVKVSLIDPEDYEFTPHAGVGCTRCHPGAPQFNHDRQKPGDCRQCHRPHDEKVAHDLHGLVACEACHLGGIRPVQDPVSRMVVWNSVREPGRPSRIHDMSAKTDDRFCQKCHRPGNGVGAAAMVLPAKSILCMPCHAATFSVDDPTTIITLVLFLAGLVIVFSYVLSGSSAEGEDRGIAETAVRILGRACRVVFSIKILALAGVFFTDVLLQRRLFRQSRGRWVIHSLIFYPILFRFLWGMIGLLGSLCVPEWYLVWAMLDNNQPATAFLFDLTGILLLLGVVLALIRGAGVGRARLRDLPGQDRIALALIGGIALVGFVLEGMRIRMTGFPDGAQWAFVGYGISEVFGPGSPLDLIYGYLWYLHALLAGAFVVYIPFSRLIHIILAPLALAANAARERPRGGR